MIIHPVDPLIEKAEGLCLETPYNTELVSINGCSIHFWLRSHTPTDAELQTLLTVARRHRDIVRATWSAGDPTGFWAHEDIS
jgi:hypothetical protein